MFMRYRGKEGPTAKKLIQAYGSPESIPYRELVKARLCCVLATEGYFYLHPTGTMKKKISIVEENRGEGLIYPQSTGKPEEKSLADEIVDLPPGMVLGESEAA